FRHEARILGAGYGMGRPWTNCGPVHVQAWAVAWAAKVLATYPGASAVFSDNADGEPPPGTPVESTATTYADCGNLHAAVWNSLARPGLVVCNTLKSPLANALLALSPAGQEESIIQPMTDDPGNFEAVAGLVAT